MVQADDTIVAEITPPGVGGVSVIRISGDQSIPILSQICYSGSGDYIDRRVAHGWIKDDNGRLVDEVLAVVMREPRSFTGEDVVEISCHGGRLVVREILRLAFLRGARLALPGEFTKRAFLHGKLDLVQAEAILDIVSARSRAALASAGNQLRGAISSRMTKIRESLLALLSEIEAGIDFPDDVAPVEAEKLASIIGEIIDKIDSLLATAEEGRVLREGLRAAIIGRPNVGKSSLLNCLLGEERAIVTECPGTTRDTIEEYVCLGGLPLVIIDTAGICCSNEPAEALGVERAKTELRGADLVIFVLDASSGFTREDELVLNEAKDYNKLLVVNKIDLTGSGAMSAFEQFGKCCAVSALTGEGIEELKAVILARLGWSEQKAGEGRETINLRHQASLLKAKASLEQAMAASSGGMGGEIVSVELRTALEAIGEVGGQSVAGEIIDNIFEKFCVGK